MAGAWRFDAFGRLVVAAGPPHRPPVPRLGVAAPLPVLVRLLLARVGLSAIPPARALPPGLIARLLAPLVALRGIAGRDLFLTGTLTPFLDLLLVQLVMPAGGALRLPPAAALLPTLASRAAWPLFAPFAAPTLVVPLLVLALALVPR